MIDYSLILSFCVHKPKTTSNNLFTEIWLASAFAVSRVKLHTGHLSVKIVNCYQFFLNKLSAFVVGDDLMLPADIIVVHFDLELVTNDLLHAFLCKAARQEFLLPCENGVHISFTPLIRHDKSIYQSTNQFQNHNIATTITGVQPQKNAPREAG